MKWETTKSIDWFAESLIECSTGRDSKKILQLFCSEWGRVQHFNIMDLRICQIGECFSNVKLLQFSVPSSIESKKDANREQTGSNWFFDEIYMFKSRSICVYDRSYSWTIEPNTFVKSSTIFDEVFSKLRIQPGPFLAL